MSPFLHAASDCCTSAAACFTRGGLDLLPARHRRLLLAAGRLDVLLPRCLDVLLAAGGLDLLLPRGLDVLLAAAGLDLLLPRGLDVLLAARGLDLLLPRCLDLLRPSARLGAGRLDILALGLGLSALQCGLGLGQLRRTLVRRADHSGRRECDDPETEHDSDDLPHGILLLVGPYR